MKNAHNYAKLGDENGAGRRLNAFTPWQTEMLPSVGISLIVQSSCSSLAILIETVDFYFILANNENLKKRKKNKQLTTLLPIDSMEIHSVGMKVRCHNRPTV